MASEMLVWGFSRLGFKLGLAAGLLGMLTALGADSPEIASATSAVLSGAREVGVGVIIGSNVFNLAALLGLPAIISGRLPLSRTVAVVDGSANLLVTFVAVGMLTGVVSTAATVALFVVILVLYLLVLALPPRSFGRLPLPPSVVRRLVLAAEQIHPEEMVGQVLRPATWPEERPGASPPGPPPDRTPPRRGPRRRGLAARLEYGGPSVPRAPLASGRSIRKFGQRFSARPTGPGAGRPYRRPVTLGHPQAPLGSAALSAQGRYGRLIRAAHQQACCRDPSTHQRSPAQTTSTQ
jgi:Sodium/calcium exchanger protein